MANASNFQKNIYNAECTHIFQICTNIYVTITHGSKRGVMDTCIVTYLETVFVNTHKYLKKMYRLFFNVKKSKELKMIQISYSYLERTHYVDIVLAIFGELKVSSTGH